MDAIDCYENDRIARMFLTTLRAAAITKNEQFRKRAAIWQKRIEALVRRDRAAAKAARSKRKTASPART